MRIVVAHEKWLGGETEVDEGCVWKRITEKGERRWEQGNWDGLR